METTILGASAAVAVVPTSMPERRREAAIGRSVFIAFM
jgi:hypothetical protein